MFYKSFAGMMLVANVVCKYGIGLTIVTIYAFIIKAGINISLIHPRLQISNPKRPNLIGARRQGNRVLMCLLWRHHGSLRRPNLRRLLLLLHRRSKGCDIYSVESQRMGCMMCVNYELFLLAPIGCRFVEKREGIYVNLY